MRKERIKMKRIFLGIGAILLMILKWIGIIILGALKMSLELAKVTLILFGLVARVFLVFVRVGTS